MKKIKLTQGGYALVDDEDYEALNQFKWYLGCKNKYAICFSLKVNGEKHTIYMHRAILDAKPGKECDHINGNKLDNRRSNLRLCTPSQNQWNTQAQKNNTSGYKGVTFHKGGKKWQARINFNRKYKYLGLFPTAKEAALAYNEAALKYHEEFALLNKV